MEFRMKLYVRLIPAAAILALAACSLRESPSLAGNWTVEGDESRLSFVTIKSGLVAEAHKFTGLSGSVSADGEAELTIDLISVETGLDVRDQRMRELLFETASFPSAKVTAQVDPDEFVRLKVGETTLQIVDATVDLHGMQSPVMAELAVTRTAEDKVQVASASPIVLEASAFDLGDGVEKLRELAGLPSITEAVPVTFSVTFTR